MDARNMRMWALGARLIVLAVSVYCFAMTYSQPREDYFVHSETLQPVTYIIPDFAVLSDVSITPRQDEHLISLMMAADIPSNPSDRGRMVVEVWFRHHASAPLQYDRAAIYVAGGIDYPSVPHLLPGQAALIEWQSNQARAVKLAAIEAQVVGNQVQLRVPSNLLSGYEPLMAVVRYLPSDVNLDHVGGGFGMCTSSSRLLDDSLRSGSIVLPPFPSSQWGAPTNLNRGGDGGGGGRNLRSEDRRPFPFVIPPSRRGTPGVGIHVPVPDTSPPTNPDQWPRPGDINGDGIPDYDYPSDTPVVGYILIDVWVTAGDTNDYVMVIGKDNNGNGKLDVDEIWYPIGECPWPHGVNDGYIGTDGKTYWESFEDSNQNASWDPGEPKRTFIYKPETGELVVIFDPDGPGGQPPREVYRGDPNGYHWHHRPR
jgi:hypothetical protein